MKRVVVLLVGTCLAALPTVAGGTTAGGDSRERPGPQDETKPPDTLPVLRETVVVTPSRGRWTSIVNSPAAVSVVPAEAILTAPDRSFGALLRAVPGVNSVKTSAREFCVTSRQATSTLANSQLVLLDGRSVYQDFIGVILWDLIPVDTADVAQIEVVRGPASAVWGANAFTGVVNILTKAPRDAEAASVQLSVGSFEREVGSRQAEGSGLAYGVTASLAKAAGERLAYRASAGYSTSDPGSRPQGVLAVVPHPLAPGTLVGGGALPEDREGSLGDFRNAGATQPWASVRLDQEVGRGRISYAAGVAGSEGIVHTGIGPFQMERGSYTGYGSFSYGRGLLRVGGFVNLFGTSAPNLLALDENGRPVRLVVRSRSYDLDAGHSRLLGQRHILTYGGNLRHNSFDISLAPDAEDRTEFGAYLQDEFFVDWGPDPRRQELRVALGARADRFDNIAGLVFSPRLSVIWKPGPNHSLRVSANQAFRAPSVVNNYLDLVVLRPVNLAPLFPELPPDQRGAVRAPFALATRAVGSPELREESLRSLEVGYVGTVNERTTLGINLYVNDTRDNINFTRLPDDYDPYTAPEPPPRWPLPPERLDELAGRGVRLPRTTHQFRNLGPIRHKGVELFLEHRFADGITGFVNYSWQPEPRPLGDPEPFPSVEITLPPRNRVNGGVSWSGKRWLGSLTLSHADRAFWVDVLPHDFDGYTEPYTLFNASLGLRLAAGRIVTTLRGSNLTNAEVRQHNFGDIQQRAVWADVRFAF